MGVAGQERVSSSTNANCCNKNEEWVACCDWLSANRFEISFSFKQIHSKRVLFRPPMNFLAHVEHQIKSRNKSALWVTRWPVSVSRDRWGFSMIQ